MINLFAGYDEREAVGFHVFASSVLRRATRPVRITPLHLPTLRGYIEKHSDGTNAFIYSRFLVPYLCEYRGLAIFADGADMLCKEDIAELAALWDPYCAVQVVKHEYETKHARKYIGTKMEAPNRSYPRKNWSSLMLINCQHYAWQRLTPDVVENSTGEFLHGFKFMDDRYIGKLPPQWNWLCDEYGPNEDALMLHWTAGVPGFKNYRDAPHANEWFDELAEVNHATD
jgi:hypothetical protein